jgi:hypothetical protein
MFGFTHWPTPKFWLLSLITLNTSCGDGAQFRGSAAPNESANVTRNSPPPPPRNGPAEENPQVDAIEPYQSMTWLWQCQNTPGPVPKPDSDRDVVVTGKGPFEFDERSLKGTQVTFTGTLCPPESQPRDIVFVIDTSASMTDNDPRTGDTCGRLKAVEAVLAATPPGTAKYGIVTFNTALVASSTMLYDNSKALFDAIAPGGTIADVLCLENGTTNYNAGMTRAGELLATGRAGSSKEVYFISDGQPNAGEDGIAIASSLKGTGVTAGGRNIPVTIGTIMLAGTDTVLQQSIASRDSQGKPLHFFVAQTGDLAKALTDLANNQIVSASLKYRATGEKDFTVLNILDHVKGLLFTLPPITLPIGVGTPGIEVVYEYTDKLGQKFTSTGQLVLKVSTNTSP